MTKTYKIEGMNCSSCAAMLELDLEDEGIKSSCSYADCQLKIDSDEKDVGKKVRRVVEKAGYKLVPDNR